MLPAVCEMALCGLPLQGRAAGAMGVPVEQSMPGDCYMWGSSGRAAAGGSGRQFPSPTGRAGSIDRADSGSSASAAAAAAATSWHSSAAPVLLDGTMHLDITTVSARCNLSQGPYRQHALVRLCNTVDNAGSIPQGTQQFPPRRSGILFIRLRKLDRRL